MVRYVVGIDPGTYTGVAIWDRAIRQFHTIKTVGILDAMDMITAVHQVASVELRIEDSRRTGRSKDDKEARMKAQGAGSIKRDCSIWEEYAARRKIPVRFIRPSKSTRTKSTTTQFEQWTGWNKRTSNHARDAAMLVWGA